MFKKLLIILILLSSELFARGSQFNFNIGLDDPDDGEARSSTAPIMKFGISSNKDKFFRWNGGFIVAWGGGLKQGEFTFGPYIYPLSSISKTAAQPFLYAEGVWGMGSYDGKSRTEAGFTLGVGSDLAIGKQWGLTLAFEQHNATETATRLWLGLYFR